MGTRSALYAGANVIRDMGHLMGMPERWRLIHSSNYEKGKKNIRRHAGGLPGIAIDTLLRDRQVAERNVIENCLFMMVLC